jgi:hypothetical protein
MSDISRCAVLVAAMSLTFTIPAAAQFGGRGQRHSDNPAEAIAEPPHLPPTVASLVLDHAAQLSLADSQRVVLESIRHTQDSANRPWVQKLDSLRPRARPVNPADLSQEQRDEIEARRKAVTEVMGQMRETNAVARQRVMALLNPAQQKQAAELEDAARKKAEEEGKQRSAEAFGGGGRGRRGGGGGGGGMGRPPED